ncbi:MAG: M3 family metallopeptidase [Calditrichaceae bacterium]|nr:M3 family metallopeptidase [Calditrichaceae bacterium]MBN2710371.1 M3 family metallopeptidase [Calditrichaceae bacterium]RQV95119.1 MAG: M3 family peptidase [Calditrichota bacterium]
MKGFIKIIMITSLFFSCSQKDDNPFFQAYNTPFETPDFNKIKETHFLPAFETGIAEKKKEIEEICNNTASPSFENTIEALESTGELLSRVSSVFYNLTSANTNDTLQEISKTIAPKLSNLRDEILMNEVLFQRVALVYDDKDNLNLTSEKMRLLDETYKSFIRGGAHLSAEDKEKLRKINEELSVLSIRFGENVLKENNRFKMIIDKPDDLEGLPESAINAAAQAAEQEGLKGKWVFTIHKPSLIPFLQYSAKRDLREKIFKAYIEKGNNNDDYDNKKILSRQAALRVEKANLLGYKTHADFILEENMAKTPDKVYEFLDKIWKPALLKAKEEAKALQEMIDKEDKNFKLQPWDWWYYAEKIRKEKYNIDDELLRPFFKLENVRNGAFDVANKLYGITFTERHDIPRYHEEVLTFEVNEADGSHIGILYVDYHPRPGKRGGAWMNNYREQYYKGDIEIRPIICNVCNFSRPTGDKPALLSLEEVETLFHEFGHALHGLLAMGRYKSLTGTNVPRDFVELPSQIMENWATDPEVIKSYALHYQTGQPIPYEYIDKIQKARYFNQGFITVEYMAAAYLDMDWHTLTDSEKRDALDFENKSLAGIGLIPEIVVRYRSPYFQHIFSGGYSAGYYSYIWAEVLDADAFEAFKEKGLFDKETATAFREHVLSAGYSDDPMEMYKRFRGKEPDIKALLRNRGLF